MSSSRCRGFQPRSRFALSVDSTQCSSAIRILFRVHQGHIDPVEPRKHELDERRGSRKQHGSAAGLGDQARKKLPNGGRIVGAEIVCRLGESRAPRPAGAGGGAIEYGDELIGVASRRRSSERGDPASTKREELGQNAEPARANDEARPEDRDAHAPAAPCLRTFVSHCELAQPIFAERHGRMIFV